LPNFQERNKESGNLRRGRVQAVVDAAGCGCRP
jgi:hypothetical protein